MSKSKSREPKPSESVTETPEAVETETSTLEADPILAEVQQFLLKRADLANRLTAEIDATEKKLVELKRTLEQLFPENSSFPSAKERKAKKAKAKPSPRASKAEPEESEDSSSQHVD